MNGPWARETQERKSAAIASRGEVISTNTVPMAFENERPRPAVATRRSAAHRAADFTVIREAD
jgi:hypothetical protein